MLQQTTVAAVQPYFPAFTARWPTIAALAAADDAEVMTAWAGLGYYARARNLLACARAVVADHGGRFPPDEATLLTLPGIGAYTAAAVSAFGFGRHAIVIDGNIERVTTRLYAIATPLPAARTEIRARLTELVPVKTAGDFAQAMMDLASRTCTPRNPRCDACPLHPNCAATRTDPEFYPVKPAKCPRPARRGTVWWLTSGTDVLTITRPAKGLLGGMRALPSCDWTGPDAAPPIPGAWQTLGAVTHGFTHFELTLSVRALHLPTKPALPGDWLPISQLDAAGLPTLFHKAATLARTETQ
ncbi:MAG: A/G-specific adenine glycosylase [Sandarakinorhabdus sp.]|nr:A/G-specific adenine glycosylase [Sandarakinorhabdus sp.]